MSLKLKTTGVVEEHSTDELAHMKSFAPYYEPDVLKYEKHWRMVQNISFYAEQAGIPEYFIYNSSLDILSDAEIEYLTGFKGLPSQGVSGAVYEGSEGFIDKMYSMVGLLTRRFIDAKFITLQDLVSAITKGNPPKSKLICIPNFVLNKDQGGNVAPWEMAKVLGWILDTHSHGKQVIIYVDDLGLIKQQYGTVLWNHVDNHFIKFQ
jgi:hypothetical protein